MIELKSDANIQQSNIVCQVFFNLFLVKIKFLF